MKSDIESFFLSYPKNVHCNVCDWEGRIFKNGSWHKYTICPKCNSSIRHRLFFAALQGLDELSFKRVLQNRNILHFAPEKIVGSKIQGMASHYVTADFLRNDCDLQLDISNMLTVNNESFDVVIVFDVLEHIPDYRNALRDVWRVLSPGGWEIFTVPQKDGLLVTYEDPTIVTNEDRLKYFGQGDHLRIFGDDFAKNVEVCGFKVLIVDERCFSSKIVDKNVLFPLEISTNPLATNYRKIFFCQKI